MQNGILRHNYNRCFLCFSLSRFVQFWLQSVQKVLICSATQILFCRYFFNMGKKTQNSVLISNPLKKDCKKITQKNLQAAFFHFRTASLTECPAPTWTLFMPIPRFAGISQTTIPLLFSQPGTNEKIVFFQGTVVPRRLFIPALQ
jgi:hypothetical protein